MSDKITFAVSIAVYISEPLDYQKFRHVGLSFVPTGSERTHYFHVVGASPEFVFEARVGYTPRLSRTFAKEVNIGTTKQPLTTAELQALMQSVPINNHDPEFNCQQWVDLALLRLFKNGILNKQQYQDGSDGMVEATLEAKDDDLA